MKVVRFLVLFVLFHSTTPLDHLSTPLDHSTTPLDHSTTPLDHLSTPLDHLKSTPLEAAARGQSGKCTEKTGDGTQCTRSDMPKSRQKRVVTLPNQSSLTMQSRLIVPQPPVGLYIIWVRVRFFIRSMFTEAQAS